MKKKVNAIMMTKRMINSQTSSKSKAKKSQSIHTVKKIHRTISVAVRISNEKIKMS